MPDSKGYFAGMSHWKMNLNMAGPEARDFFHSIRVGTKGSGRRPRSKFYVKWSTEAHYCDKIFRNMFQIACTDSILKQFTFSHNHIYLKISMSVLKYL